MKIRDLIMVVMVVGMVAITGILVGFAANGITDIEDVTSESSSDELVNNANQNLQNIAIGIRDSLDNQMTNQYEMVTTWAQAPTLVNTAKDAQNYSMEDLYDMWSEENNRVYDEGEAVGDGNPNNDLNPTASQYLATLATSTSFPEIFITDNRGYAIAANAATGDFDQGPDDWRYFHDQGYIKHDPAEGGEGWYRDTNDSADGFLVGAVEWDGSASTWGIDTVAQMRDPVTNEYLGQIKALFNYGSFIDQFVTTEELDVYEIKVVNQAGGVVATSLDNKSKVNNENYTVSNAAYFTSASNGNTTGASTSVAIDENGESVYTGYAVSSDVNGHIVVVTMKESAVSGPIDAFVGGMQSDISDKGSDLQTNMIIVGAVVALIILAISFLIMRAKISAPISKLTEISKKLSKGDIEGLKIDAKGTDEIGQLGESFEGVLAAFETMLSSQSYVGDVEKAITPEGNGMGTKNTA